MFGKFLYIFSQWTWGILQTLVGLILFIKHRKCKHYNFHGACVTVWNSKSSISLGQFIFITNDPFYYYDNLKGLFTDEEFTEQLLVHEYGHTIQSLILGPLYGLVIGTFSFAWSYLPVCAKMRENGASYFDLFCEKNANTLGELVTKKKSLGRL